MVRSFDRMWFSCRGAWIEINFLKFGRNREDFFPSQIKAKRHWLAFPTGMEKNVLHTFIQWEIVFGGTSAGYNEALSLRSCFTGLMPYRWSRRERWFISRIVRWSNERCWRLIWFTWLVILEKELLAWYFFKNSPPRKQVGVEELKRTINILWDGLFIMVGWSTRNIGPVSITFPIWRVVAPSQLRVKTGEKAPVVRVL